MAVKTEEHVPLTEKERGHLNHRARWGSDGYPVTPVGGLWVVNGPVEASYKTKRGAYNCWERYIDTLIKRAGVDAYNRATA